MKDGKQEVKGMVSAGGMRRECHAVGGAIPHVVTVI